MISLRKLIIYHIKFLIYSLLHLNVFYGTSISSYWFFGHQRLNRIISHLIRPLHKNWTIFHWSHNAHLCPFKSVWYEICLSTQKIHIHQKIKFVAVLGFGICMFLWQETHPMSLAVSVPSNIYRCLSITIVITVMKLTVIKYDTKEADANWIQIRLKWSKSCRNTIHS